MSEQGKSTYTNFWVYQVDPAWRTLSESDRNAARDAFIALLDEAPSKGITLRGLYSTVGMRPDCDLILWGISEDFDALQCFSIAVRDSALGNYLTLRHAYPSVALGSKYTSDHAPAFVRGLAPKRYLSMYPFVKTHEWYQVPFEERRSAMAEHGQMGREYPDIQTNTVSSFGISDWEFVVAFEGDDVGEMVRMVEYLRPAASRPYTKSDTPIFLGVLKSPREVLADLG